jgi:Uma2 family endonuclease
LAGERVTPAEYLARDRRDEWKNEYVDGCIMAMPYPNVGHATITGNVLVALHTQLRDGPCEPFTSRMRMRNLVTGRYLFPDLSMVCGEARFDHHAEDDTLLNPTLIVEVVSPATEAYDRGDKFADYRRIPSLQEYVLIAQDRPSVDHFLRQGEQWLLTPVTDLNATVTLPTIGCTLLLREIYRRVQFSRVASDAPQGAV